jgi:hypothetical protein
MSNQIQGERGGIVLRRTYVRVQSTYARRQRVPKPYAA